MSSLFNIVLVLHILGVLALFGAITLELVGILLLRRADTINQVRDVGTVLRRLGAVFGFSSAIILLSGIYMTIIRIQHHESVAWVIVSLVLFIAMGAVGSMSGEKMGKAMQKVLAEGRGMMTPEVERLLHRNPSQVNAAFGPWAVAGLVFLMVVKPNVLASVLALVVSMAAGFVTYWQLFKPSSRSDTTMERPAKA